MYKQPEKKKEDEKEEEAVTQIVLFAAVRISAFHSVLVGRRQQRQEKESRRG